MNEGNKIDIPAGAKCELCGMLAEYAVKDEFGVTHYYCRHHLPKEAPRPNGEHDTSTALSAGKHAGHTPNMFRDRFWISLLLTIPVIVYSEMVQRWLKFSPPEFPGSDWIPLIFGTTIFFYGGLVFLKSAVGELRARLPGMMTLISLAITSAFVYSIISFLFLKGSEFFWDLSTLITVMLFGHWMEMRSVVSAQGALKELAKLLPDTAELIEGDSIKKVALSELKVNDLILIRPGAKVAADGIVVEGESSVNESMITGESKPVKKVKDSKVIAGTVNGSGSLKVRVTEIGERTALAGIMRLVSEAQRSRSKAQILADKAAFYLTVIAIVAGTVTLAGWLISDRGVNFAFERMVTVLVIACPHALGLAIPLVTAISTSLGAKSGLLVRNRMALESARNIDVVLFDKTGTLTLGEQGVVDAWPIAHDANYILSLAAAVEADSEHMIGKAMVKKAKEKKLQLSKAQQFSSLAGKGVEGLVNGKRIAVGGPQLLTHMQKEIPSDLKQKTAQADQDGKTVVYVLEDDKIIGAITLADVIREESKTAINQLQKQGIRVAMITGDSEGVAVYVAKQLGIKEYFAQVLPEHKVNKVKELQKDGSKVAMVGDGVNDAPALVQADIGIAIGAGTDVAIESAGIILVKNDPRDVVSIFKLSKATYRKMQQNLVWATGYNLIAIPLAGGVLAGAGIILPPAVGALLMSVSTIIVALNAQFLRKLTL